MKETEQERARVEGRGRGAPDVAAPPPAEARVRPDDVEGKEGVRDGEPVVD